MSSNRLQYALAKLEAGLVPVPPLQSIFVGDGDYLEIAAEFLTYFVEIGGLTQYQHVLDIGSGIGRMTCGLSCYLDPVNGYYIGFEPVKEGVEWCRTAYAERPNFQFEWVDLYNELYRPDGTILATEYAFPCEPSSVDFAIATSVFTHLYEPEIAAYCRELARVLRPEGRLFSTAYLFDGDKPVRVPHLHLQFDEPDPDNPHRWHVKNLPPLASVCYSEAFFIRMFEQEIGRTPEIRRGRWRDGPGPWFQDLVLL